MQLAIPFGENGSAACDIDDGKLLAEVIAEAPPLPSIAEGVRAALDAPIGFPPLDAATVPGDRIVLALDPEVTEIQEIASGVLRFFAEKGLTDRQIVFLLPSGTPDQVAEALRADLASFELPAEVQIHAPADQKANSFLTSDGEDRAIFLNREICEADVVIPIGLARPASQVDYFGPFSALFPAYGDIDCQRRWSAPGFVIRPGQRKKRLAETGEVGDLLGILCVMQLVPASGGGISQVLFGMVTPVIEEAARLRQSAWRRSIPETAQVVLALVSGDRPQQTWANAARALASAERILKPGGAVILCTEIREPPSPALAMLTRSEEPDELCQALRKCRLPGAWITMQFASTLRNHKIYLRSLLAESMLDDMGLIPVGSDEECQRICDHYGSTIVLHDAQSIAIDVVGEVVD